MQYCHTGTTLLLQVGVRLCTSLAMSPGVRLHPKREHSHDGPLDAPKFSNYSRSGTDCPHAALFRSEHFSVPMRSMTTLRDYAIYCTTSPSVFFSVSITFAPP